ncbi:MAG: hypothetical protein Q4G04_06695 [bacterium]|nr:hypothetical protein [bacterium]
MLLETNSTNCLNALDNFYKLIDIEKLEVTAILMEHWNKEQILDNDNVPFIPSDIDFNNSISFSALCLLLARVLKKEKSLTILDNDFERKIKITYNIDKCLTYFYKLNFDDKLHYLIEILFDIYNTDYKNKNIKKNITSELPIFDISHNILNY